MWGSSPSQHLNLKVVLTLLFIWISALNFIISFFDPIWQSAGSDCWGLCRPSSSPFPELAWHETNAAAIKAAVCLPTSTTKKHEEQPARRPATIKKKKKKGPPSPQETPALLLALSQLILSMMHFSHGGTKSGVDLEFKRPGREWTGGGGGRSPVGSPRGLKGLMLELLLFTLSPSSLWGDHGWWMGLH